MSKNTVLSATKKSEELQREVVELSNGEELNRAYPDTFWIPTKIERETLQIGALVKIIAKLVPVNERFWVEITELVKKGKHVQFYGDLRNDLMAWYAYGSKIGPFEPKHVIEISSRDIHRSASMLQALKCRISAASKEILGPEKM